MKHTKKGGSGGEAALEHALIGQKGLECRSGIMIPGFLAAGEGARIAPKERKLIGNLLGQISLGVGVCHIFPEKMLLVMEPNAGRRVMFPTGREKRRPLNDGRDTGGMANKRRTSKLNQQIDENLRRVYSDTVEEPLPERFTRLLDQLRQKERDSFDEASEDNS